MGAGDPNFALKKHDYCMAAWPPRADPKLGTPSTWHSGKITSIRGGTVTVVFDEDFRSTTYKPKQIDKGYVAPYYPMVLSLIHI